jgi:hypothetical protein
MSVQFNKRQLAGYTARMWRNSESACTKCVGRLECDDFYQLTGALVYKGRCACAQPACQACLCRSGIMLRGSGGFKTGVKTYIRVRLYVILIALCFLLVGQVANGEMRTHK